MTCNGVSAPVKMKRCDSARSPSAVDSSPLLCAREWAECCVRRGAECGRAITSGTAAYCAKYDSWGARRFCSRRIAVRRARWRIVTRRIALRPTVRARSAMSYDAQLALVDNVREAGGGGKVFVTGDELLLVRASESATASGGEAAETFTAQQSSGNRGGYDDAKLRFYESSRGLISLAVGDRAICPRPLLSATQSVPRACVFDSNLASASASAYRRSRGVEHVFDLTGWARTAAHWRRADPPASTGRRVGRARSRTRYDECL